MKKISVYQVLARVLVTVMTIGALILLVRELLDTLNMGPITAGGTGTVLYHGRVEKFWDITEKIILPFSFRLELLPTQVIGPLLSSKFGVAVTTGVMAVVAAALVLSQFITRGKHRRVIQAMFLGLCMFDMPMSGLAYNCLSSGDAFASLISIVVHIAVVFCLFMSLRKDNKIELFSKHPADEDNQRDKNQTVAAPHKKRVFARAARIITIALCVGNIAGLILNVTGQMFLSNGWNDDVAWSFISLPFFIMWFMSYEVPAFSLTVGSYFHTDSQGLFGILINIISLCLMMFLFVFMLYIQKFYTKSGEKAETALVTGLTITVIDSLTFLWPGALMVMCVSFFLHVFLIVSLMITLKNLRLEKEMQKEEQTILSAENSGIEKMQNI